MDSDQIDAYISFDRVFITRWRHRRGFRLMNSDMLAKSKSSVRVAVVLNDELERHDLALQLHLLHLGRARAHFQILDSGKEATSDAQNTRTDL